MDLKKTINELDESQARVEKHAFDVINSSDTSLNLVKEGITNIKEIVDTMIVKAKNTSSDFIDGIDAEDLVLVLDGSYRKALKNDLDSLPNGTRPENGSIGVYDSVEVL